MNESERLMRILQATPDLQHKIDLLLEGKAEPLTTGPLLMGMSAGAKFLGVSRPTLWRMLRAGKLKRIEVLPGSFRVQRADLEALAAGK